MDEHDKQFESYLRQFRLKNPGPLPELASLKRRSAAKWVLAAAAVVLSIGVSMVLVRKPGSNAGPKATVEIAGNPSMYQVGEVVEAGRVIRSNSAVGLLLALEDGSHVEMHSQSELKLESAADGIRVHLNSGSILVTAAKQDAGHLYVQTRDAVVSVVGTVFLVNAEQSGTTVAVVEGEVHVQQGAELKKLLPGEQIATNPAMPLKTVAEQIAWSRGAPEYMALLQQPAETRPQSLAPAAAVQAVDAPAVRNNDSDVTPTPQPSSSSLPFKVQANYIRVTSDQVRTLITIQLMNRDLSFQDEGGGKKAKAHIQGVIYRIDNRRLPGFSQDVALELPSNTFAANLNQPTLFQESRYLTPGKYKIHITVEDTNSHSLGVQDYALNVPRIPDQSLQASSLILAYSITDLPQRMLGTDMFALGGKRVKPNVTGVFRPDENLNIWQEIYGLTVDPASRKPSATFEMLISQNGREIRSLSSNSTEVLAPGQKWTYVNNVPLSGFVPGLYEVQLKVTDNLAKVSLVTVAKFSVASPSTQSDPPRENPGKSTFYRACSGCHVAELAGLRNLSTRADYANLVSRQQSMGAMFSAEELPALIDYLFATYGKKADPPIPSDIPVQKQ